MPVYASFQWMRSLYPFDAENEFNPLTPFAFAIEYEWMPWVLSLLYVVGVFGVDRIMKQYKPFDLRTPLIVWNALLSIFSVIGALRTVPHLIRNIMGGGLHYSMCAAAEPAYGVGATGFWVMLFIYSKPIELFDTAFIVLRKKRLIVLHWYHHITVMLYAWYSYKLKNAAGLWFIAMNFTVHAVMYCYYALVAARTKPSWDYIVTAMQISQMVVGVLVCVMVPYYANYSDLGCKGMTAFSYAAGVIMYSSYLLLFVMLAVGRYCVGGAGSKDSEGDKALPVAAVQAALTADAVDSSTRKIKLPSEDKEASSEDDEGDSEDEEDKDEKKSKSKPKPRRSKKKPRSRRSSRVAELLREADEFQVAETELLRRRRNVRSQHEQDSDEGEEAGWGGAADAGPIADEDRRPLDTAPQHKVAGHRPVTRSQSRGRLHP